MTLLQAARAFLYESRKAGNYYGEIEHELACAIARAEEESVLKMVTNLENFAQEVREEDPEMARIAESLVVPILKRTILKLHKTHGV